MGNSAKRKGKDDFQVYNFGQIKRWGQQTPFTSDIEKQNRGKFEKENKEWIQF